MKVLYNKPVESSFSYPDKFFFINLCCTLETINWTATPTHLYLLRQNFLCFGVFPFKYVIVTDVDSCSDYECFIIHYFAINCQLNPRSSGLPNVQLLVSKGSCL